MLAELTWYGIAVGAGAVEVQQDHARRVVGQPRLAEAASSSISVLHVRVARAVAADVDAQRIAPFRVLVVVARQDDAGPQVDRPAVELAQQLRAELDVLDLVCPRRQFLRRDLCVSSSLTMPPAAGRA